MARTRKAATRTLEKMGKPLAAVAKVILLAAAGVVLYGFVRTLWPMGEAWGRMAVDPIIRKQVVRVPVRVELMNPPKWMDRQLLTQIAQNACDYFTRTDQMRDQICDPLDGKILREMADYYSPLRPDTNAWLKAHPQPENAWIKRISQIRRVRTQQEQRIEITAEFRQPAAVADLDGKFYLLDKDAVRLPGEYSDAQRRQFPFFMVIKGLNAQATGDGGWRNGPGTLPEPGMTIQSADAAAALELADVLGQQGFAHQVAAIDISNFGGRLRKDKAQITLETAFGSLVIWGRPAHEEKFYEVPLDAKLKALGQLASRFGRIDAGRPYVDIRFEQILVPKQSNGGGAG